MITLRITDNREDIRKWTGLPSDNYDKALWDVGFNLDDWDICIESDTRLFCIIERQSLFQHFGECVWQKEIL